jgi:hypothetical protein
MDLAVYRQNPEERERTDRLLDLVPHGRHSLLDVGSRDGFVAKRLRDRFSRIVALDLEKPEIDVPSIETTSGDVTALQFEDNTFDTVLCAEVLEHIPPPHLQTACAELMRVVRRDLVIGVPFKQDLRALKTTCPTCGRINPPYGHINVFDHDKLYELFAGAKPLRTDLVGSEHFITNSVSSLLMTAGHNPSGSYEQEEPCMHCGAQITPPASRPLYRRLCSRLAHCLVRLQRLVIPPHPKWIHVLFEVPGAN